MLSLKTLMLDRAHLVTKALHRAEVQNELGFSLNEQISLKPL